MQQSSFLESETILRALEFAQARGGFANAQQRRAAAVLIKRMKSNRSTSGRRQHLIELLKRGASLEEMIKAVGASRRTIFRYLTQFEDAGLSIVLERGRYRLGS